MRKSPILTESYPPISELIKALAKGVMNSSQLADIEFGVVEEVNPLKIRINQHMIFTDEFLILTNAVKDHSVDVSVSWNTEAEKEHTHGNGNNGKPTEGVEEPKDGHKHQIKGRKRITIHNGLTVGEKVLLLRTQGGQNYVVIDRVDEIPTTGEWL